MSKCISRRGEYSDHIPDADYICTRCGALDEDGMVNELRDLREERDALRVGVAQIADDRRPVSVWAARKALRALLDRTSITGE